MTETRFTQADFIAAAERLEGLNVLCADKSCEGCEARARRALMNRQAAADLELMRDHLALWLDDLENAHFGRALSGGKIWPDDTPMAHRRQFQNEVEAIATAFGVEVTLPPVPTKSSDVEVIRPSLTARLNDLMDGFSEGSAQRRSRVLGFLKLALAEPSTLLDAFERIRALEMRPCDVDAQAPVETEALKALVDAINPLPTAPGGRDAD